MPHGVALEEITRDIDHAVQEEEKARREFWGNFEE